MSQLVGKTVVTKITGLDIVSDDGKHVLRVTQNGDTIQLVERDANDSPYGWKDRITYTLDGSQQTLVSLAVRNGDAQYDRGALDKITSTQFQIEQPKVDEPTTDCSPIAVADAQAAAALVEKEAKIEAVKFEMRLDHTRDRHITADVEGCPLCEGKVLPRSSSLPVSLDLTQEDEDDLRDKDFPF
jgi:hypothetical protein